MDFVVRTIVGDLPTVMLLSLSSIAAAHAVKKIVELIEDDEDERQQPPSASHDEQQEQVCLVEFQRETHSTSIPTTKKRRRSLVTGMFSFSEHRDSLLVYKEQNESSNSNSTTHTKNTKKNAADDDDETASTVDMDEDSSLFSQLSASASSSLCSDEDDASSTASFASLQKHVSFPDDDTELVTDVYTRPRTTKAEKYYLHYDEYDYLDFKLEYRDEMYQQQYGTYSAKQVLQHQQRKRPYYRKSGSRKVGFKLDVVDSVHPVMDRAARQAIQTDLFYTANEMRQFLDEFVASLQLQQHQHTKPDSKEDTRYQEEQQHRVDAAST